MRAEESSKLPVFTLAILPSLAQQRPGERGATFQNSLEGRDRIVRDRLDGHPVLAGQGHHDLVARLQADLLAQSGGDDNLPFRGG
jgi:hypothetical protein